MMRRIASLAILAIAITACSGGSEPNTAADDSNSDITPAVENTGSDNPSSDDPATDNIEQDDNQPRTGDTLKLDNADAVIMQAFEVLTGRAYDQRLVSLPFLTRAPNVPEGEIFASSYNLKSNECDNAGSLVTSDSSGTSLAADYTECEIAGNTVNGRIELSGDGGSEWSGHFSNDFRVGFLSNGIMEVSGNYRREGYYAYSDNFAVADFNYHLSYSGGTLRVENANTERTFTKSIFGTDEQLTNSMTGSFTMFPPVLDNAEVTVEISSDFTNYNRATQLSYDRGLMHIRTANSEITLDADTGDPQTVLIELRDSNDIVSSKTSDWSTWFDALAYSPPNPLVGSKPIPAASGDGNLLSEDSYDPILRTVFNIFTGERTGRSILNLPGYSFPEFPLLLAPGTPDGFGEPILAQCDGNGEAYLLPYKFGARQITQGWDAQFSNCSQNNINFNGLFRTRNYGNYSYSATDFILSNAQETTEFDGGIYYKNYPNRDGGPTRFYTFNGTFKFQNGVDDFEIQGRHYGMYVYEYLDRLNANFSFRSNETSQQWIQVTIIDPLLSFNSPFPDDRQFSSRPKSGLMHIDAGNGNSMFVVASNGNEDTFSVYIYQPNLPAIEKVLSWDDYEPLLDFNFDLKTQ
jgi:hypothetical protein